MNSPVKEQASEMASHIVNSPKVQGSIGTVVAAMGGYSLIEAAQTILGLISLVVGIAVGLYALVNAHKASKKADIELYLLSIQRDAIDKARDDG